MKCGIQQPFITKKRYGHSRIKLRMSQRDILSRYRSGQKMSRHYREYAATCRWGDEWNLHDNALSARHPVYSHRFNHRGWIRHNSPDGQKVVIRNVASYRWNNRPEIDDTSHVMLANNSAMRKNPLAATPIASREILANVAQRKNIS